MSAHCPKHVRRPDRLLLQKKAGPVLPEMKHSRDLHRFSFDKSKLFMSFHTWAVVQRTHNTFLCPCQRLWSMQSWTVGTSWTSREHFRYCNDVYWYCQAANKRIPAGHRRPCPNSAFVAELGICIWPVCHILDMTGEAFAALARSFCISASWIVEAKPPLPPGGSAAQILINLLACWAMKSVLVPNGVEPCGPSNEGVLTDSYA